MRIVMQASAITQTPENTAKSLQDKIIQALNHRDKEFSKFLQEAKLTPDELIKLLKSHTNPIASEWKDKEPCLSKFVMRLVEDDLLDIAKIYFPVFKACFEEEPLLHCFGQVRSAAMVEFLKLTGAKMVHDQASKECETALLQFIADSIEPPKTPEPDSKDTNQTKTIIESILFCGKDGINHIGACGTALDWAQNKEKYNPEWQKVVEFLISQGAKSSKEILKAESAARVADMVKALTKGDITTALKGISKPATLPQIVPPNLQKIAAIDLGLQRAINSSYVFRIPGRIYGDEDNLAKNSYPFLYVLVPRFTNEKATIASLLQFIQNANETQMRDSLFFTNSFAELYRDIYCRRDITHDQYDLHIFPWNNNRLDWLPDVRNELLKDLKKTFQNLSVVARCVESTDTVFRLESLLTFLALKPKVVLNLEQKASTPIDQALQSPLIKKDLTNDEILSALDEIFKVTNKKSIEVLNVRDMTGRLAKAQVIGEGFFRGISFPMPNSNIDLSTAIVFPQTQGVYEQKLFSSSMPQNGNDTQPATQPSSAPKENQPESKDIAAPSSEASRAEMVEYVINRLIKLATPPPSFLSCLPLHMRSADFVEPPEPKVPSENEAKIKEYMRVHLMPKAPVGCTASIVRDETIVDLETLRKLVDHFKAVDERLNVVKEENAALIKRFS